MSLPLPPPGPLREEQIHVGSYLRATKTGSITRVSAYDYRRTLSQLRADVTVGLGNVLPGGELQLPGNTTVRRRPPGAPRDSGEFRVGGKTFRSADQAAGHALDLEALAKQPEALGGVKRHANAQAALEATPSSPHYTGPSGSGLTPDERTRLNQLRGSFMEDGYIASVLAQPNGEVLLRRQQDELAALVAKDRGGTTTGSPPGDEAIGGPRIGGHILPRKPDRPLKAKRERQQAEKSRGRELLPSRMSPERRPSPTPAEKAQRDNRAAAQADVTRFMGKSRGERMAAIGGTASRSDVEASRRRVTTGAQSLASLEKKLNQAADRLRLAQRRLDRMKTEVGPSSTIGGMERKRGIGGAAREVRRYQERVDALKRQISQAGGTTRRV